MLRTLRTRALAAPLALLLAACGSGGERAQEMAQAITPGGDRPDEPPAMLNREPPFRYPTALYERKVQGNVTLHLWIDADGQVRPESTRVEESSGFAPLDSAAVKGSQELRFTPAKRRGEPMATAILFPVFFRHPEASPLPGDTVLKRR
jgi:protein TonB